MNFHFVPLLQIQRDLLAIPGRRERFRQYLRTIFAQEGTDAELVPLLVSNPMAKDHVAALLDTLLEMNADAIGARAASEATARSEDVPGEFPVALVVADDLRGGWTNRYDCEYTFRFGPANVRSRVGPPHLKQVWVTALLWSSEPASERAVQESVLAACFRLVHVHRHGRARTLREKLVQEGRVMMSAGCTGPVLDVEELAYTREVIAPHLDAEDMPTTVECLFGDSAGRTLGFTPRGLSPWAGLALALHDAKSERASSPNGAEIVDFGLSQLSVAAHSNRPQPPLSIASDPSSA